MLTAENAECGSDKKQRQNKKDCHKVTKAQRDAKRTTVNFYIDKSIILLCREFAEKLNTDWADLTDLHGERQKFFDTQRKDDVRCVDF